MIKNKKVKFGRVGFIILESKNEVIKTVTSVFFTPGAQIIF
jgi:hypothetical protein